MDHFKTGSKSTSLGTDQIMLRYILKLLRAQCRTSRVHINAIVRVVEIYFVTSLGLVSEKKITTYCLISFGNVM